MESRLSWRRAQHAANEYDVTVICAQGEGATDAAARDHGVTAIELPINRLERALMSHEVAYYLGYRLWHRRVYRLAFGLHKARPFAMVHQVSLCGYREPSDCWRLGVPFVWGPIGGTPPFPLRFLGQLDLRGAARELVRNVVNACQLRFSPRVRSAMHASAAVLAANREVARDLDRRFGCTPRVQLETGVSDVRPTPRAARDADAPLKILWTGRLRSWKGLPILLRALADLPSGRKYVLRVMGAGSCLGRWQRLAAKLGIDGNIEWAGWPSYSEQLPHYEWADVFAFTSLRDTSGAGLLEALAAGAPIIGLDHQGAADVMSRDCAIPIPAASPKTAIAGFRDAIERLTIDGTELARLSEGAIARAREFHWDRQWRVMQSIYREALVKAPVAQDRAASREAELPALPVGATPAAAFLSIEHRPAAG
jgi:glycosyltransferase involved in cell wall biosynthesis